MGLRGSALPTSVVPSRSRKFPRFKTAQVLRFAATSSIGQRNRELMSELADERRRSRRNLWAALIAGVGLLASAILLVLLRRAQQTAARALEAKSQFVAAVSHEIRTPINGIIGMTDLLRETPLSPLQSEFAESAHQSAESLLAVIGDVLDLARLEAGKYVARHIPFVLRDVLEGSLAVVARTAWQKNLHIGCFVDPSLPAELIGDANALRQIMLNLLGNAVKFTERGSVIVRAEAGIQDHAGVVARISVEDTGIGIDPEALPLLFEPFRQLGADHARRAGGSGLGLTISRKLVEAAGGQIEVESAPGVGSTFRFVVPFGVSAKQTHPEAGRVAGLRVYLDVASRVTRETLREQLQLLGAIFVDTMRDAEVLVTDDGRKPVPRGMPLMLVAAPSDLPKLNGFENSAVRALALAPVGLRTLAEHLERIREGRPIAAMAAAVGCSCVNPRRRVLVAEDNTTSQTVARHLLQNLGFSVDIVENGHQAVDAVRSGAYAAVLMDCAMPELDGIEATRRIRTAQRPDARIPIIALTASAFPEDEERCRRAGMDDFLVKPIDRARLRHVLERWT